MLRGAFDSYAAGMETIARNTPQLTQETPASTAPTVTTGAVRKCATVALKALKAAGHAYLEGAKCNPYWIGTYWFPGATTIPWSERP